MPPFPPSILHALLSKPRRHEVNDDVRALRERSERSRFQLRRPRELHARHAGRVTAPVATATDESARKAA